MTTSALVVNPKLPSTSYLGEDKCGQSQLWLDFFSVHEKKATEWVVSLL